jgi:hypothetical protein
MLRSGGPCRRPLPRYRSWKRLGCDFRARERFGYRRLRFANGRGFPRAGRGRRPRALPGMIAVTGAAMTWLLAGERREFITLLGGAATTWLLAARAPRIRDSESAKRRETSIQNFNRVYVISRIARNFPDRRANRSPQALLNFRRYNLDSFNSPHEAIERLVRAHRAALRRARRQHLGAK